MHSVSGERVNASFCVEVDSLDAEAWDQLAGAFDDMTTDQVAHFVDNHWTIGCPSHLILRHGGIPVAAARLIVLTLPVLDRGLAYCRFGPIWRRRGSTPDLSIYRAAVQALFDEYCRKRGHYLTIIPRPNAIYHSDEVKALTELGFKIRRPFDDTNRYIVEVQHSADAQLQGFEQKWRYNLNKAMRNKIEVCLCSSTSDINNFCRLYRSMVERKGFSGADPIHLLPQLATHLPEPLRPHIVIASKDGRPLAGAVVAILGDTAFYVFGASDDKALPLKAGYALHWWITRWLADLGIRWYDLGGEALSDGLRQFKKGFVGKNGAVVYMAGEYDRWADSRARFAADAIYLLRAGQRVYRSLRYKT